MSDNGRISLLFVANLILYFLIGELNNGLSVFKISLHLDILIILFFGLYIGRTIGLIFAVLLGFLANAAHPVPAGTYVLGYVFMWVFLVWTQNRIRRQNPRHVGTVATAGQVIFILILSLIMGGHMLGTFQFWHRLFFDLLLSAVVVYFVSWPWCRFQQRLLHTLGWNLDAQLARR